ncbi:hypothetical protein IWW41_003211 [Coemansia sp. RSA 2522]|nr:hypothetical protein IWW41_003211 [Coemansia sp. RSA 2522]
MFSDCPMYTVPNNILNTKSEQRIRMMSGVIRSRDDWFFGVNDPEIRARCTHAAKKMGLTKKEVKYMYDELEHYEELHVDGSNIRLSAVDSVWMSDSLIDADITQELKRYVAVLENVLEKDRDYHPNTNNQVVNLVDPSLYPLIYARSRVLSPAAAVDLNMVGQFPGSFTQWVEDVEKVWKDEQGKSIFYFPPAGSGSSKSEKFCWLPTEFRVHDEGAVTIESYINNLHPVKHAAFYPTIARIFSKFVPMLEHVLTDVLFPRARRVRPNAEYWFKTEENEPEFDNAYYQFDDDYWALRGHRLQAILKMSNIMLTPDQPEYNGGDWHVEAMANERIVATGIYYYDVENITESTLNFRESVKSFHTYNHRNENGVNHAYGLAVDEFGDDVSLVQEVGDVQVKNGRCVVFPNTYQHQMSGFKLVDPTKPGHCKILTFFFIDPTTRIPSTEIVPPQQREWWSGTVMEQGALGRLPALLKDQIGNHVDFPISLAEAKVLRLELMDEHSANNSTITEDFFSPSFTLSTN